MSTLFLSHSKSDQVEPGAAWHWFDVVASAAGLALLSPLLGPIALAIKLSDGGPILYRQKRMGKDFKPFFVFKFRTMVVGADRLGAGITAARDPRVTWIGRYLRRYKLDELPQLLNVLRGDMALVGPRPEIPKYAERFRHLYGRLLTARPGITDPASIEFSNEEELLSGATYEEIYTREILPKKLALSLDYFERRTWRSDLAVVFRTFVKVSAKHATSSPEMDRSVAAAEVVRN
jgi:lipopolysaccharide/colanic/teichoic acid biosynthesis glycosyltransferase